MEIIFGVKHAALGNASPLADSVQNSLNFSHTLAWDFPSIDDETVSEIVVIPAGCCLGGKSVDVECNGIYERKIDICVSFAPVFGDGNVGVCHGCGFKCECICHCFPRLDKVMTACVDAVFYFMTLERPIEILPPTKSD